MSFFNKFLTFFALVLFVSCSPHDLGDREKKAYKADKESLVLLLKVFSIAIDDYKEVIQLLEEERYIYYEMEQLYYKVNRIYNKIIEKQQINSDILDILKAQTEELNSIISNLDTSVVPKNVFDKLEDIQSNLDFMKSMIDEEQEGVENLIEPTETEPVEVPVEEEPVEVPVEEEPVEVPVEEEPVAETEPVEVPVEEEPVEVPVEEEPVAETEPVEVPVEEEPVEVPVEEEPVRRNRAC